MSEMQQNIQIQSGDAGAQVAQPSQPETAGAQGQQTQAQQTLPPHTRRGRQAPENPLAGVQYGRQPQQAQQGQQPETQPEKKSFDDLIKGEYRQEYAAKVQEAIKNRFRDNAGLEKRANAMQPILDELARRYGMDAADPEAIAKRFTDDDSLYEEEASKLGVPVGTLKQMKKLEAENARMKAEAKQSSEDMMLRSHFRKLVEQSEEMKNVFPGFDLEAELQNPSFARLTSPEVGISVRDAYFALHHDDIQKASMQYAARQAMQQVAQSVQANGARTVENGMLSTGAVQAKTNPKEFTRQDREEIRRRVRRGENVFL